MDNKLENKPVNSLSTSAIIPYPHKISSIPGELLLTDYFLINSNLLEALFLNIKRYFQKMCTIFTIPEPIPQESPFITSNNQINIIFKLDLTKSYKSEEAYDINISSDSITIQAPTSNGCFYAISTLFQIIKIDFINNHPQFSIPCGEIHDWPVFPIRGFMHDVGRNFQSIEYLKTQIDMFAFYKLNVFHWHLTDNPAWRIESKKYPQLNCPKNHPKTRDPGAYYTFKEIREFIQYCNHLGIQVIPEIDMPGHSAFFKRTFRTRMNTPKGMRILKKLLTEFCEEIPQKLAPIIHIGSDEVHINNRKKFIRFLSQFMQENNRQIMMWNPGLNTPPQAILQYWNVKAGYNSTFRFIDSAHYYINNSDPLAIVPKIFFHQPCYMSKDISDSALGGILCLWPDVNVDDKKNILRHNPVQVAVASLSERLWQGLEINQDRFMRKLPDNINNENEALLKFSEFEDRLIFHRDHHFPSIPFQYVRQSLLTWQIIGPFPLQEIPENSIETMNYPPEIKISPCYQFKGQTYSWQTARGGTINFQRRGEDSPYFQTVKSGVAFALTNIWAPVSKQITFWIGFDLPYRSNRRYRGLPNQGKWGSTIEQIWLNDIPVNPPIWVESGKYKYYHRNSWHTKTHEIPFSDAEFYWTRPAISITLNAGNNKLLIRVPKTYNDQNWVLTFIPVKWNAKIQQFEEVEDISFSHYKF